MTRALTYNEVEALEPDDLVARYRKIGSIEVGRVLRVTTHTLVIEFEHTGQLRYDRGSGRQLGCKGNQLRTVPEATKVIGTCECCGATEQPLDEWTTASGSVHLACDPCWNSFDLEAVFSEASQHDATDLGDDTANVEPNDEAQIVEQVKHDRAAAKRMTQQAWLDAVQRHLEERLTWDHATLDERRALQAALSTAGTEPQEILVKHLSKNEVPYYTASQLSAWVYRQRRDARQAKPVAHTPDFAAW